KSCKDQSLNCPTWKQHGQCEASGPMGKMMHQLCKLTCGLCKKQRSCIDDNALCPTWSSLNQCQGKNKPYMEENCPLSCKTCGENNCQDSYHACKLLATVGYCSSEKQWMSLHCRETCNFCITRPECGKSFLSCTPLNNPQPKQYANGWEERIVGGDTTVHGEVPWQVLINIECDDGQKRFCGASLLTQKWVITAAHCFKKKWVKILLSFGTIYHLKPDKVQNMDARFHQDNIIVHPEYVHRTKNNDIALVKLVRPMTYSRAIQPICLPFPEDYHDGQTGIVTGWGTVAYKGSSSEILLKVCLKVRNCDDFQTKFTITDNMICAYEDGKDACQGDSGGPLVVRNRQGRFVLLGIVSKGRACALKDMPGAYTKVSNYIDWINKTTGEEH
ncbi:unnamed protein product, partial [Meganyctiphanes norvegica]